MTQLIPINRSGVKPTASNQRPLPLTIRNDRRELDALWALTTQQRIDAMWGCQLTMSQLTEWTARRPREVPLLDGEYAWLVMHTPEWAEAQNDATNVIELPQRGERRAAA